MNQEITHHSGMKYIQGKTYFVAGARSAWDQVKIGLFESRKDGEGSFPQCPECIREATTQEVKEFFNLS